MKLYREWVLQPNQRHGCMLPLNQIQQMTKAPDAGYASVYAFAEEHAKQILAAKSSAGLTAYPVYSDMLMIDLDDGDRQLRKAEAKLAGYAYTVWESGGKGYHIGIALSVPMYGLSVPYSQRKWVEALDIGADLSLYQHGRVLSLPGRLHPKTGKRKQLIKSVQGAEVLTIPELVQPAPTFGVLKSEQGELAAGLWQLIGLLENEPSPGNRHTKIWSTAKSLADAGLKYDTVLDLITQVNETWQNPKELEGLTLAVRQAYKRS